MLRVGWDQVLAIFELLRNAMDEILCKDFCHSRQTMALILSLTRKRCTLTGHRPAINKRGAGFKQPTNRSISEFQRTVVILKIALFP